MANITPGWLEDIMANRRKGFKSFSELTNGLTPEQWRQAILICQKTRLEDKLSPDCLVFLGDCYSDSKYFTQDDNIAVQYYQKAAEKDHPAALASIGYFFDSGRGGLPKSMSKAIELYHFAAKLNFGLAYNALGSCYKRGQGVEQNWETAAKFYEQGAEGGIASAQYNAAYCYFHGKGVKQDYFVAAKYFGLASSQNYGKALAKLGYMYDQGFGVEQDRHEAVRLYKLAGDLGNFMGLVNLASCYKRGHGVEQDWKQAVRLYKLAEEREGGPVPQFNLGLCYLHGRGVKKNSRVACTFFEMAGVSDHSGALLKLGECFEKGQGVKQSWKEAAKFYTRSADLGDGSASYLLGLLYLKGKGVKKNKDKAVEHLELAAHRGVVDAKVKLVKVLGKVYNPPPKPPSSETANGGKPAANSKSTKKTCPESSTALDQDVPPRHNAESLKEGFVKKQNKMSSSGQKSAKHRRIFSASVAPSERWCELKSVDNQTYFANAVTGKTSWTRPAKSKFVRYASGDCDWTEFQSPDGEPYFYNAKKGISSWMRPLFRSMGRGVKKYAQKEGADVSKEKRESGAQTTAAPIPLPFPWEEHLSKDGQRYFYNPSDGTSTWTEPRHDGGAFSTEIDPAVLPDNLPFRFSKLTIDVSPPPHDLNLEVADEEPSGSDDQFSPPMPPPLPASLPTPLRSYPSLLLSYPGILHTSPHGSQGNSLLGAKKEDHGIEAGFQICVAGCGSTRQWIGGFCEECGAKDNTAAKILTTEAKKYFIIP